ncbi:MAG: hypothetical protein JWM93_1260, partial [Frankiales bacterium]|nr:hypothetical protein [Frankiales bacterium]
VTAQPSDSTHNVSETATFTSSASGLPLPAVQWQSSPDGVTWTDISGATSTTLSIAVLTHGQNGLRLHAVFTNSTAPAAVSNAALLVVNPAPSVTDPLDVVALERTAATFIAAATPAAGTPAPTVQWQLSTDAGASWTDIVGATNDTLTLPFVLPSDSGNRYRAVYTNTAGVSATGAARLTVVVAQAGAAPPGGEFGTAGPTIRVANATVLIGARTSVTGFARAWATVDLYGYTHPSTTYRRLGRTRADASGAYTFSLSVPAFSRFRVRVNGSDSKSVAEFVRARLTESATKVGARTYVFTGTVRPLEARRLVTIYYVNGAGAQGVAARGYTDRFGHYRITHTFSAYGRHEYTTFAYVASNALTLRNHSASRAITTYRAR